MQKQKIIKQTSLLFLSQLGIIALGLGIKYIQTHELGNIGYGEYALFVSLTTIAIIIFRFGFFASLQVLLANNHNQKREKELIGAGFIITLLIGLVFSTFIWILSFRINDFFNSDIGNTLQLIAPLCIIIPFHYFISAVSVGTNRVGFIAMYNFLPKLVFLLALMLWIMPFELTVFTTILLNLGSSVFIAGFIIRVLNPSFNCIKENLKLIWTKNRQYGLHYYSGSVFNQTTYRLDELFISYFINTIQLGFYSLANLICSPMVLLSQSLSQSLFKKFADSKKIPRQVFIYNTIWLTVCIAFLYFAVKFIVEFFFGSDFQTVSEYVFPLSFAFLFQGLCAPYAFLAAKSKGKEIRNVAWLEAIANIAGNIILIPTIGVLGAIYSSIAAKFLHFMALNFYYRRYLKEKSLA